MSHDRAPTPGAALDARAGTTASAWTAVTQHKGPPGSDQLAFLEEPHRRRAGLYRRLVRGAIGSTLARACPHATRLHRDAFQALSDTWLEETGPQSPRLADVPSTFALWLQDQPQEALPHPAFAELVHYEALEVDVELAPDLPAELPPPAAPGSTTLDPARPVVVHPSARVAVYAHPVHTVGTKTTTLPATTAAPSVLLLSRHDERLRVEPIAGTTAQLLLHLFEGRSLQEAEAEVERACAVAAVPVTAVALRAVAQALADGGLLAQDGPSAA